MIFCILFNIGKFIYLNKGYNKYIGEILIYLKGDFVVMDEQPNLGAKVEKSFELIGKRWTGLIIYVLMSGQTF